MQAVQRCAVTKAASKFHRFLGAWLPGCCQAGPGCPHMGQFGSDMPVIRVNAQAPNTAKPCLSKIRAPLAQLAHSQGPIVIMTHGYSFLPGDARHCPHRHILASTTQSRDPRALSWPQAMGLAGPAPYGAAIAFGWAARGSLWQAWHAADAAGQEMAMMITQIRENYPARPIYLMGHSMGARVICSALPYLKAGDVSGAILLAGATYRRHLADSLNSPAGKSAWIVNICSLQNRPFDLMLEAAMGAFGVTGQSIGRGARHPRAVDIQIDAPEMQAALLRLGIPVARPKRGFCHWSVYALPGIFLLYRRLVFDGAILPQLQNLAQPQTAQKAA